MSKAKITKPKVIQDSQEDSDSSVPIVAPKTSKKQQVEEKKVVKKQVQPESSDEEDTPVVAKKPTKQVKVEVPAPKKVVAKKPVKESSSEEESEEQKPKKVVAKVKSPVQKPVVVAKKPKVQSSDEEESSEEVKVKPSKVVQKVVSPVQKPVVKKVAKKVESSSEQSEEQVKKPIKVKSPVLKAKSPVLKAKSPVQKPLASKKKAASSSEEQQEKPQPKKNAKKVVESSQEEEPVVVKKAQKVTKKVEQVKMVDEDEQGEFQACVRGLSFNAYDSDIREFFSECGNVSNVKLLTRDDGKSKGVAFVKFSKKSSFNAALELNGSEHLGRSLTIEQSQGKKPAPGGAFGGKDRSYGQPDGNANIETPTLFIGGISYNSTVESITSYFSQAGDVASARIVTDKQTGRPRGFGYVEFHDVDTAKKAYKELNGGNLDGRAIRLDSAAQRDRPQGSDRGGFGGRGSFGGGGRGSFGGSSFGGGRGAPRNPGNSTVVLSQDDKNAKKGSIGTFAGKKMAL